VPEGDTIFRSARTLNRALAGQVVTGFRSMLPKLTRIHEDAPVTGRTIESVTSAGKWMMIRFSGDLILLTHMLMSGSWHIYRPGEKWFRRSYDMRIVLETKDYVAVGFMTPIAEFHTEKSLAEREGFKSLGQDVLGEEFDEQQAVSALKSRSDLEAGDALLNQSLLAGVGNVFKSEVCFACGVNPFKSMYAVTTEEAAELIRVSRKYLLANVTDKSGDQIVTYTGQRRTTNRMRPQERLWVYGRNGFPCRKCGTEIVSKKQGKDARITFWCPRCQPL
jgi:endonuclease-8